MITRVESENLVQRIFDDADRARPRASFGAKLAKPSLRRSRFSTDSHCSPCRFGRRVQDWRPSARVKLGISAITLSRSPLRTFILMPHLTLGGHRTHHQPLDLMDLLALPRVGDRGAIGDELGIRLEQVSDDAQAVAREMVDPVSVTSTMASTRPSAAFASVAPQENSTWTSIAAPRRK